VGSFNTYGIEWFPERIDFLVNGAVTFSYPKKANLPADQLQWPFDQSFHLILNLALGGSWVGAINDAILPVQTEIDHVKVFALAQY
jgi:beta-glucanase (GH16 family)